MKFTIDWLKEHLDTNYDDNKIVNKLTDIGLEVESFQSQLSELDNFKFMKTPEITPKLEADAGEIRWICTTGCPKETYGNFVLNRKTLELRSATEKFNCEVLPSSITLKEKLSSRVNELQNQYDEELKGNKI